MSQSLPPDANLRQLKIQAKELCRACRASESSAIRRVIDTHPRFHGATALEVAARIVLADAQLVIARELGFENWPTLKGHLSSPSTASIHQRVIHGDMAALKELIARSPDSVNQPNESGLPPLYTAALYRNQQAVDLLLDHGATVDIFACGYLGRAADAEMLLKERPALAKATTPDGMTALHYAARAGHGDVVQVLLRHATDVNAVDQRGRTALAEASHAGPWKPEPAEAVVRLLLDHGAQVDLFQAAAIGRAELVKSILDSDPGLIDSTDNQGQTALHHAARNNHLAVVRLLVERGADVNRSDAVGIAALHRTSQECSDELIQYLIDHGANAHLCCYVACGDEAGTRRMLERNREAANEIFYEFNAVGYAIHSWQLGTLRILIEHGCILSEEDQLHILRISNNDQTLLNDLLAIRRD